MINVKTFKFTIAVTMMDGVPPLATVHRYECSKMKTLRFHLSKYYGTLIHKVVIANRHTVFAETLYDVELDDLLVDGMLTRLLRRRKQDVK